MNGKPLGDEDRSREIRVEMVRAAPSPPDAGPKRWPTLRALALPSRPPSPLRHRYGCRTTSRFAREAA